MSIERLEELKKWFHIVAGRLVSSFHAENCYLIDYLIDAEIDRRRLFYGAKLCPFCAGEATMKPEGDYWEITCDDCGVFKQGNTYEQALNEWNFRRL